MTSGKILATDQLHCTQSFVTIISWESLSQLIGHYYNTRKCYVEVTRITVSVFLAYSFYSFFFAYDAFPKGYLKMVTLTKYKPYMRCLTACYCTLYSRWYPYFFLARLLFYVWAVCKRSRQVFQGVACFHPAHFRRITSKPMLITRNLLFLRFHYFSLKVPIISDEASEPK